MRDLVIPETYPPGEGAVLRLLVNCVRPGPTRPATLTRGSVPFSATP
jgi:hypothetical protein